MKFYTVQSIEAYKKAKETGYLRANKEFIEPYYLKPYRWLSMEMRKRLSKYNSEFPIWLWDTIDNISVDELLDKDSIVLEVELNRDEVIATNYEAWHIPLNNGYFSDELFNAKEGEVTESQQYKDWETLFDEEELARMEFKNTRENIQYTTGDISIDRIKEVKYSITTV